ncbi:PAS domain S-box protein [Poseidonibacter lekithochrous]|uniref:PAS domain S-box protein n=1 Tax=Poseidonibacter lekithochrous TaxID=1904463 RepID=UPI000D3374F4|nr:PAS domain S-box protein [Poseidonibacter lekithochrous]
MHYKGSIKKRLIIIIMLIASLTGLISYGSFVYWYMQNQHERAMNLAHTVGLVLGQDFAKLILLNEVSAAADITSQLKSFSTLNSMVLYKLDKKAIFQYNKENESFKVEVLPLKPLEKSEVKNNTLKLYINASYKDTKLGYAQLNFQIDTIVDVIKRDIEVLVLIFAFILFISYFLAIYYAKRFTKPILNLVSFLEKIEHSESLNKRITTNEQNEFGKLYDEANTMLERISSSHEASKLAAVAFETQSGMIITDKNRKILQVNKAFTTITGYEPHEVISKTPSVLKSGLHTQEFYDEMFDNLDKQKFWMGEISNLHKNGSLVNENLTIQAVLNESDEVIYYVASFIDITLQKRVQEKLEEKDRMLVHQSKMAAMGEMIGNIAHQWRQPLSVVSIITSGMIVKKDLNITNEEDDRKELKKIGDTVTYLSETIDDFKNFFKPDKEKKIFNVKDCYKKTMNLVDSRLDSLSIEVIENLHDVQLNCLENELKQVIMNLLNNSKDALEQRDDHRRLIFIDIYEENDNAIFFIKDTGGGIPSNVINNIFKPYFSTKDKDQGTGIGLYMSIEMVEKHMNGQLLVENESFTYDSVFYKGACFKIIIPQNL